MSRIGDKIREERTKKGLSPKQLARKCGVAESFILDIESGRKIINEKLLNQLSKVLGKNIEESMTLEIEEKKEEPIKPKTIEIPQRRAAVTPLTQWENALSNIIKNVPIYDIQMKTLKGHKSFPIIDKKVEGLHPDKLVYVEPSDDALSGFRICKGDQVLIYLNHELKNNAFSLIEYQGKNMIRKLKRIDGNKIEIISYQHEIKKITESIKDIKIIGHAIRVEIKLS